MSKAELNLNLKSSFPIMALDLFRTGEQLKGNTYRCTECTSKTAYYVQRRFRNYKRAGEGDCISSLHSKGG